MLDTYLIPLYVVCMATEQPQQYYSYAEAALLCRRSYATIKTVACRLKLPRIRQVHAAREHRIALLPYSSLQVLLRRTLLRGQPHGD